MNCFNRPSRVHEVSWPYLITLEYLFCRLKLASLAKINVKRV